MSKNNTFAGDVTILGGNVTVTNNNSLGVGPKTVTISGTVNAPSLQLNNASGVALPAGLNFVTSNDDATVPAILNVAGNNSIGGNLALADGGFGTGQTRIKVNVGSLAQFGEFQGFLEYPFCAKPLVTPDQIVIHARQKNHDCGGIANGSQLGHEIDPTHGR